MSPPLVDSRRCIDRNCTCQKCGPDGKYITKSTWYRHNPGGVKGAISDRVDRELEGILALCRPASEKQKRPRHQEDQEVEDSPHMSK